MNLLKINSRGIKFIVVFLAIVLSSILVCGIYLRNEDTRLSEIQLSVEQNFIENKNITVALNSIYRSTITDYEQLGQSYTSSLIDTNNLELMCPNDSMIQEIKNLILKKIRLIESIKESNTLINKALKYNKAYVITIFGELDIHHDTTLQFYRKVSRKMVDLSYEIKQGNSLVLNKYKNTLDRLKKVKLDKTLEQDRDQLYLSGLELYEHTQVMLKNIEKLNNLEEQLNKLYIEKRENIAQKRHSLKQNSTTIQITILIILSILIFLI